MANVMHGLNVLAAAILQYCISKLKSSVESTREGRTAATWLLISFDTGTVHAGLRC
jgi:hypothetical protein